MMMVMMMMMRMDDDVEADEVEDGDVEDVEDVDGEEDRSQDRGPHFVRACAVEMHVNISQEPLFTEIHR